MLMTAINPVSAGVAAAASPQPHQVRKEADHGRDEATEAKSVKAAEIARSHKLNIKA